MNKEQFNKLKQSDRIEYLLRKQNYNNYNIEYILPIFLMSFLNVLGFHALYYNNYSLLRIYSYYSLFVMIFSFVLIVGMLYVEIELPKKQLDEQFLKRRKK